MTAARVAVLALGVNAAAAFVSVRERMPAEWGKGFAGRLAVSGRRDAVLSDFLTWRGTALAPPLPMMAAIALLASLAARGSRRAARGLAALGAMGLGGYLGEAPVRRLLTPAGAEARDTTLVAASIGAYAALLATGLAGPRPAAPPPAEGGEV